MSPILAGAPPGVRTQRGKRCGVRHSGDNRAVRRESIHAATVAFIASFCTLVIEISAGRVMAPLVGVSLYTWTSVIGVVLAGISLGAWAGGWLADRWPRRSTLGRLLLVAGVTTSLIAPVADYLAAGEGRLTALGVAMTLVTRVVVLAFLLFFIPSFFLGMISPVAVKLAVHDLETAGRVVGGIYAVSTIGSIAGTFVTGFWLIARFGTRTTLAGVGAILLLTALFFGGLLPRRARIAAGVLLLLGAIVAVALPRPLLPPHQTPLTQPGETGFLHDEESEYYRIRVERVVSKETGVPLHAMHLDHLVHSYSDLADPAYLHYEYLRIFDAIARRSEMRRADPKMLFVGGGGYTLPRLVASRNPRAAIDVVEIDPSVTRVARRWFALGNEPRIRSFHHDARWFAMNGGGNGPYDLIFIDAFNDLSVPWHLTTFEAGRDLRALLHPDGAIVANVVDDFENGRFLASYVRTLQRIFPDGSAAIVLVEPDDVRSRRSTFVAVAAAVPGQHLPVSFTAVAGPDLERWLTRQRAIVLTDDYAPVDNMLAPLFTERFADEEQ